MIFVYIPGIRFINSDPELEPEPTYKCKRKFFWEFFVQIGNMCYRYIAIPPTVVQKVASLAAYQLASSAAASSRTIGTRQQQQSKADSPADPACISSSLCRTHFLNGAVVQRRYFSLYFFSVVRAGPI